jgi:hypothetical protein
MIYIDFVEKVTSLSGFGNEAANQKKIWEAAIIANKIILPKGPA